MGINQSKTFISRLLETSNTLNLCAKEKECLDVGYDGLPTRKRAYSDYRKVISESDIENKSELLKVFSLTKDEKQEYNDDYRKKVYIKNGNLRCVYNYKQYIDKAISIIDNNSYADKVVGFAALTGRRVAEIATSADFKIKNSESLIFKGQLKNKNGDVTSDYEIPCLYNTFNLIKKFDVFREEYKKYLGDPKKFNSNFSKYIGISTKKHFKEFVDCDVMAKDLRAIYGRICCNLYKPDNETESFYFAKILGHSDLDLTTCNSYLCFRLVD